MEVEAGMTLRDYITRYAAREKNEQVDKLVDRLGVNRSVVEEFLAKRIDEANINEFGRFDALRSSLDVQRAKAFFEQHDHKALPVFKVRMRATNMLKRFVLMGGFDIDDTDNTDGQSETKNGPNYFPLQEGVFPLAYSRNAPSWTSRYHSAAIAALSSSTLSVFPRELNVCAAGVAISGGLQVDRALQVEFVDDGGGAQVEDLAYGGGGVAAHWHALLGAEGLHVDEFRVGNTNSVGDLDLDLVGQAGSPQFLGNPTGGIRGGTIDLGRVLAGERATAVVGGASVGVDDDLAAGQTGVGRGPPG